MDQTYHEEVLEKTRAEFTKERFDAICSWRNREEYEEIKEPLEFNTKCMLDVWKERVAEMMVEEFLDALGFSKSGGALEEHLKRLLLKE